ncbi:MAG TPA: fatty acid desaturase [Spirochaetia bacterium]|nr:fatty acid desaturase [Spirochaetia bacterium]
METVKPDRSQNGQPAWTDALKPFEKPDPARAFWQLSNTLIPYLGLLALMYFTTRWHFPVWLTLLLSIPAGALLVRLFIFFHDCVHGSYLRSKRGLRILGTILGILTFTPFAEWRYSHGVHHSTSGNLDRRGTGDVWTMTVDEYAASNRGRRFLYRLIRNPFVMFGFGPIAVFLVKNRFPNQKSGRRQAASVLITDLAICAIVVAATLTIGIKTYLLIQLPTIYLAGVAGIWLFYVQHQFDPSYWARTNDWGSMDAALQGSSYYKLPKILQWISGNIGFHHIHHLRPRIPNYNLQRCLELIPQLRLEDPLTFGRSLRSVRLNIWDEEANRLLSFRSLSTRLKSRPKLA